MNSNINNDNNNNNNINNNDNNSNDIGFSFSVVCSLGLSPPRRLGRMQRRATHRRPRHAPHACKVAGRNKKPNQTGRTEPNRTL